MPIFIRRFYIKLLEKSYKEEKAAYDKSSKKSSTIQKPPHVKK